MAQYEAQFYFILLIVYNLISVFPSVRMYAALIRYTHLCCCLVDTLSTLITINELVSMHFYTNCALKWPLILTLPEVRL